MSVDWWNLRYQNLKCKFTPRSTWSDAVLKTGAEMLLSTAWFQDIDDKYPGEYALEAANDSTREMLRSLGVTWVPSGDVTPIEPQTNPGNQKETKMSVETKKPDSEPKDIMVCSLENVLGVFEAIARKEKGVSIESVRTVPYAEYVKNRYQTGAKNDK